MPMLVQQCYLVSTLKASLISQEFQMDLAECEHMYACSLSLFFLCPVWHYFRFGSIPRCIPQEGDHHPLVVVESSYPLQGFSIHMW